MTNDKTVSVPRDWFDELAELADVVAAQEPIISYSKEGAEMASWKQASELNIFIGYEMSGRALLKMNNDKR
jgi:hypothetical protein